MLILECSLQINDIKMLHSHCPECGILKPINSKVPYPTSFNRRAHSRCMSSQVTPLKASRAGKANSLLAPFTTLVCAWLWEMRARAAGHMIAESSLSLPALAGQEIRAPCWQQLSCSQLLLGLCCSQCDRGQKMYLTIEISCRVDRKGKTLQLHCEKKTKCSDSIIQLSKVWVSGSSGTRKSSALPFCLGEVIWGKGRSCQKQILIFF